MSALRQHEYEWYLDAPAEGAPKTQAAKKKTKVNSRQLFLQMAIERMLIFLVVISIIATAVAGCTFILMRYVEIHRIQGNIYTQKQTIKSLDKKRDELLIQKESEMTLEELEDYASNYLGMIKATEGYKVVVSESYHVVANDLIKPGDADEHLLQKPSDDPLIVLGAWIKRLASF